ncbi:hypothetical protein T4E_8381 [Trichinella pseudospiralis]|uniref:Uncharacterized protein n=1 Tax=Trichinella pseudospiralis TaxID=6337 RepID=A0A0V0YJK1_TRIPS|nr:hypothetical protein T4E_8381 [Trichinella pseudospiralis]
MSAIGCFSDWFNGASFAPSGRECQLRRGLANQKCQQQGAPTGCGCFSEYKLHAFRVALRRGICLFWGYAAKRLAEQV